MCELLKGNQAIRSVALTPRNIAVSIAELAFDKKAEDIVILDMKRIVNFCDYFVICSGNTDRQVRAIADHIDEGLEKVGSKLHLKKGMKDSSWIVFDTGDIVTHIFQKQLRDFYRLEHLWQEAKMVNWKKG